MRTSKEPCTSGQLPFGLVQECIPNYEDLTDAEKCLNPRYLVKTLTDTDGHTEVTTYTIDPVTGECTSTKTCSGTQTTETNFFLDYDYQDPTSQSRLKYYHDVTETTVVTWNADCTTSSETTCSGESNTIIRPSDGYYTFTCNSTSTGFFSPEWAGTASAQGCRTFEYEETCTASGDGCEGLNPGSGIGESCVDYALTYRQMRNLGAVDTITVTPEPTNIKKYEYSQLNEATVCTPLTLPAYPPFTNCTPEGEEPPASPELTTGQGYSDSAYQYINPKNTGIKSIRKVSYRVVHKPMGTCYLKVWFRKKIQPYKYEDCDTGFAGDPPRTPPATYDCNTAPCSSRWSTDGPPTYENGPTYEWNGSDYPCIPDKAKLPSACENDIYGESASYVLEAAAGQNAVVTLEYKWSAVKGYEPNWPDENGSQGCKPDGFPTPDPATCPAYINPTPPPTP